jgi:hypothetical protein
LRCAPAWGVELLRSSVVGLLPPGRRDEAVDLALGSARPGQLLRALVELGATTSRAGERVGGWAGGRGRGRVQGLRKSLCTKQKKECRQRFEQTGTGDLSQY